MGPARSTVLRDMLVSNVGQVVGTIDSVPLPGIREVNWSEWLSYVLDLWSL